MNSAVLSLQQKLLSSDCDLEECLRESHLIATKLDLDEFDKRVKLELYGYEADDHVPSYRKVKGQLKALNPYSGWIPTMINDTETERTITEYDLRNSISELQALISKGDNDIVVMIPGENQELLGKMFKTPIPMEFGLHITQAAVISVINKVQNTLLDWTLNLEKAGIAGDSMLFNDSERAAAKEHNSTLNKYYGPTTVINAPTKNMQVANGNQTIEFSYSKASDLIDDISKRIEEESLDEEDKESIQALINTTKDAIDHKKKPAFIKASLSAIKDFLIEAGANITADIIIAKMNGMF